VRREHFLTPPSELATKRLGPLPIITRFLDHLAVEHEPLSCRCETVSTFSPSMFGVTSDQANSVRDDHSEKPWMTSSMLIEAGCSLRLWWLHSAASSQTTPDSSSCLSERSLSRSRKQRPDLRKARCVPPPRAQESKGMTLSERITTYASHSI
jgi:hypothetical protein